MEIKCDKCGTYQDAGSPTCGHLKTRQSRMFLPPTFAVLTKDQAAAMGRKGGRLASSADKAKAGRKGGASLAATRGPDYFKAIGLKGTAVRREKRKAAVFAAREATKLSIWAETTARTAEANARAAALAAAEAKAAATDAETKVREALGLPELKEKP